MGAFEHGRESQAGQMYAQRHYKAIMFWRRARALAPWFAVAIVLLASRCS